MAKDTAIVLRNDNEDAVTATLDSAIAPIATQKFDDLGPQVQDFIKKARMYAKKAIAQYEREAMLKWFPDLNNADLAREVWNCIDEDGYVDVAMLSVKLKVNPPKISRRLKDLVEVYKLPLPPRRPKGRRKSRVDVSALTEILIQNKPKGYVAPEKRR